jgi:hypothetical protein
MGEVQGEFAAVAGHVENVFATERAQVIKVAFVKCVAVVTAKTRVPRPPKVVSGQ